MGSGVTSPAALPCCLAAGFFEPVGEHGLGVLGCPVVGEHFIETWLLVVEA
jgi:hypothetical protein